MSILNNEITTPRQKLNGTRSFRCLRTGCLYVSCSSGWVRRRFTNTGHGQPLNKQIITSKKFSYEYEGKKFYTSTAKREMIPHEVDRLALIARRAESYRK